MTKTKGTHLKITIAIFFLLVAVGSIKGQVVQAATPVTVDVVDYEDEVIIVNNNGNAKILFAREIDAANGKWEEMEIDPGSSGKTAIDISWVSPNAVTYLRIRGDEDLSESRIKLIDRTKKLDITINYSKQDSLYSKTDKTIASLLNIMTTAGTAAEPISYKDLEWKKGVNGSWKSVDDLTVYELEKFQIMGADLYFRIKAVNDITIPTRTADGSKGRRTSNEFKLKINKKANAKVVAVDGSKFNTGIKFGMEYRLIPQGGVIKPEDKWTRITNQTINSLKLSAIFNDTKDGTTSNNAFVGGKIQVRNYGTAKIPASKITTLDIKPQRTLNQNDVIRGATPAGVTSSDSKIYISYQGKTSLLLTIPKASTKVPYEYSITRQGETFDLEKATWTAVTKGTVVKIASSKAVEGGTIYIRQKEIKEKPATKTAPKIEQELASTYVTHSISYNAPDLDFTLQNGTESGATRANIAQPAATGNRFVYTKTNFIIANRSSDDTVTNGTEYVSGDNIAITAGEYLTVYEINWSTKKIVRYRSIQVNSNIAP